ncbi:MAG: two-component system chemotaxis family sensor kinase CheA [Puniceicoccaceae bacterium 5H]|nr:MAG: two-component system chemotaxis family sensor kinase CheA [Puniceicoccaceae bacterium 5H]
MSQPDPAQTFLLEAEDLLAQVEETALDLNQRPADPEAINRMFRAFHTLKGSGAMFGFDTVAAFTHHVETALDRVRAGELELSDELLGLLLASRDQINRLLLEPDSLDAADESERIIGLLGELTNPHAVSAVQLAPTPQAGGETQRIWHIRFRPGPGVTATGLDPVGLLEDLRSLGTCEIVALTDRIPPLDALNPEHCYLGWDITLTTSHDRNAIQDVFIFVEDESEIAIEAVESPAQAASGEAAAPQVAPTPVQPEKPTADATPKSLGGQTLRVPSAKLDHLVKLVGELVMNQSRLMQVSTRIDDSELASPVEAIERLVAELRDSVLGIRMMPIGTTFSRFKRLVHDLSNELGKEVHLVTEGAETELDKTVLDQLGDPLVHLIRNSLDHGFSTPEERLSAGKARHGTLRLSAAHEGSEVVITIEDDGKGINPQAIREKALERGLIAPDAVLSDREIYNLIFLPGFSTAKTVTSISGRGVGMDAVKKQLEALRGSIELSSERGKGTTVRLTLPLTLAIIEGLAVELDGDRYIVPMSAVTENVELHRHERTRQNGRNLVTVRDELVPYIRLRELFGITSPEPEIEKIVITRHEGQRVGIVVDRVLGSHQTVIQSLGRFYQNIRVCSGATILGDGRVALILDIDGVVEHSADQIHQLMHQTRHSA